MSEIAEERFLPSSWVERDRQRLDYFIPNYLVKWLDSSWTICSVGCGSGYDVECLRRIGFDAFGFDPGARTAEFCRRGAAVPFLRRGKAEELPWGKGRFDVVYALEVIEHVGCKDFGCELLGDSDSIRVSFLEACLDMLKPGGKLLLTSSNRACPLDPGHRHLYSPVTRFAIEWLGIQAALPWHPQNFLLGQNDVRRLMSTSRYRGRATFRALSVAGYPRRCGRRDLIGRLLAAYLKVISILPLRTSALAPILACEVRLAGGA